MSEQTKDDAQRLLALLLDAAREDQTPDDAETELVASGVNVTAFLGRVQAAVQAKQKAERLADWHNAADANAAAFADTHAEVARFAAMTHEQLVAEAQQHAHQLHFKNYETATDDDLRSALADLARLQALDTR